MFDCINYDSWKIYDGASEGSGRSEKVWLIADDGTVGLFKYPKTDPSTHSITTEHISEHLAHQLGEILGVPTAKVEIGTRGGRVGSMSYLVRDEKEALVEGIAFISGAYPAYDAEKMIDTESGECYCIEQIFTSVPNIVPKRIWIEMMMFDFLIGNADRHQSNWALLLSIASNDPLSVKIRRCPLYDNGSSLCSYVTENQVISFKNDYTRFNALADSKSKSIIRIDGTKKERPRHLMVAQYLIEHYPEARLVAQHFVERLKASEIENVMKKYPAELLSTDKNMLIRRYLIKKIEMLAELL